MATTTKPQPDYTLASASEIAALTPPRGRWTLAVTPASASTPSASSSSSSPSPSTTAQDQSSLSRAFKFKTFNAAWSFMSAVAEQAKRHRHHPEWSNTYNQVYVRWRSHKIGGAVAKVDLEMARVCDEVAAGLGEVIEEGSSNLVADVSAVAPADGLEELVGRTGEGCDACATGSSSSSKPLEK